MVLSTKTIRTPAFLALFRASVTPTPIGETTIALAPLVTASWISAIWQGVSSLVLHALVVSWISFEWSFAYFLAPAIMASQKPPVAFVRRVTLILPSAARLSLPDAAAVTTVTSIAHAPSTISALSRVDMCVVLLVVGSAARVVRPVGEGSNGCAPPGPDDPGHELLLVVRCCRRFADLASAAHHHRAVRNGHHVVHRVRDQDDRDTGSSEPIDQLQDPRRLPEPEGSGRLVEDDELGGEGHRPGDSDRLPLTTRHQRDVRVEVGKADLQPVEELLGAGGHLLLLHPLQPPRKPGRVGHLAAGEEVRRRVEVVEQGQVLVDGLDAI